ncbi:MAG TPA: YtxH domain-containing protein [Longimicrobium sp.]|nr:YtxH domain-containing protein [Longimicrobium sp.]
MGDYDDLPHVIIERRGAGNAFVLGALVGAGAALLLAPRSGTEMQAEITRALLGIRSAAGDRVDGARGAVERTRDQLSDGVHAVRGAVEARAAQARSAVGVGRAAATDARAELQRRVEEAKATYRAGRGGTVPPRAPAAEVVVVSVSTEADAGDLAR